MWVDTCGNYVWIHVYAPPIEAFAKGDGNVMCVCSDPYNRIVNVKDTSFTVN